MTSNNGGSGGPDNGVPVHTAEPCASFGGLVGANDSGNALFEGSRRYLAPNVLGLLFHDVFNMDINMPEEFGTYYSTLNRSTAICSFAAATTTTRATTSSTSRAAAARSPSAWTSVTTFPERASDAFVSHYAVGDVQSITVNANDGNDSITLEPGLGIAVTANGGDGNDTIVGGVGPETLNGARATTRSSPAAATTPSATAPETTSST